VRELTVGGAARLMTALDHWLPALSDRVMAEVLPRLQQGRAPAGERQPDGLHAPAGDGRERSGDEPFVREWSAYSWAARNPAALLGAAALCGAALALAGASRRRW
jgi:hypothetical protein